jgi:hypothetical protein
MDIESLDIRLRTQLYGYTKKVLRKYQKGIASGKLTANIFAQNILEMENMKHWLDENVKNKEEFRKSYINYIDKLINNQSEFSISPKSKLKSKAAISKSTKPTVTQQLQLKNVLKESEYELTMPFQYLTASEVDNIIKYIKTGKIDLGSERVYNYIKNQKH